MLYQLFKSNKKGKDYCVGDLHGNYDALYKLLQQVKFDFINDRLFCVGDLTDRGANSKDVLKLLKESWFHTIRGNHEDIIIKHGLKTYDECYPNGKLNKDGNQWFFKESIEHREKIIRTFQELPYAIQVGDIGLVHAYPLESWKMTLNAIKNKNEKEIGNIVWNRNAAKSVQKGEKITPIIGIDTVIVGHHIFDNPERHANVIFLDTGYYSGGSLSLLDMKTFKIAARIFNKDLNVCII